MDFVTPRTVYARKERIRPVVRGIYFLHERGGQEEGGVYLLMRKSVDVRLNRNFLSSNQHIYNYLI